MENRKDNLIDDLNENQKIAVLKNAVPLRILAGAGSGKTKVLTRKIAYLIDFLNVNPSKIVALTFSNKAANEMKSRVNFLVGEKSKRCTISTFHSICTKILRFDIDSIGINKKFIILDSLDKKQIIKSIMRSLNVTEYCSLNDAIYFIYNKKMYNVNADSLEESDDEIENILREIFIEYEKKLRLNNYLDFDDLQIYTYKLLQDEEIRKKWQNRIDYLLVDEFQDTSDLQYQIIKLLTGTNFKNITIVGDPDQTIYSWRGANISLINNFDKDFDDSLTITLNKNYRSDKKILEISNNLIKNNKGRLPKILVANSLNPGHVNFFQSPSIHKEAQWVIEQIKKLNLINISMNEICIMYRSNFYSRSIEEALINNSIQFKTIGSIKFYERKEIKDCISFLRTIFDMNDVHLLRVINTPKRKVGEKSIEELINLANKEKKTIFETFKNHDLELKIRSEVKNSLRLFFSLVEKAHKILKNNNFDEILNEFLKEIDYFKMLEQERHSYNERYQNVNELLKSMKKWILNNPDKDVSDYLEEIALASSENEENPLATINLMTIHASKGLEYKCVFLLGLNEGIFPNYKTISDEENNQLEEERRLAYVAITRAKNYLFLSCASDFDFNNNPKKPSRFLKEMGIQVRDFDLFEEDVKKRFMREEEVFFEIGDKINHLIFGTGIIIDIKGDLITIKFDDSKKGIKNFLKNHSHIERVE